MESGTTVSLSSYPDASWTGGVFTGAERKAMLDFSFKHWKRHSPYLKAYLALTLHRMGRKADAALVFDSIMDSARTDPDLGTYWAPEDRAWLWYNDTIETHAFALRALMELRPADSRREGLVQWLFLNKKLNHWKSTRATAEVLYALVQILTAQLPDEAHVLVDDGVGQGALRFLKGQHLLLHGALGDEAVGEDLAGLADAMCAVHGLGLHGGVPPGVEQEHVLGGREVQAQAPRSLAGPATPQHLLAPAADHAADVEAPGLCRGGGIAERPEGNGELRRPPLGRPLRREVPGWLRINDRGIGRPAGRADGAPTSRRLERTRLDARRSNTPIPRRTRGTCS